MKLVRAAITLVIACLRIACGLGYRYRSTALAGKSVLPDWVPRRQYVYSVPLIMYLTAASTTATLGPASYRRAQTSDMYSETNWLPSFLDWHGLSGRFDFR